MELLATAVSSPADSWTRITEQRFHGVTRIQSQPLLRGWSFLDNGTRMFEVGFAVGNSVNDPRRIEGWHSKPGSPVAFVVEETKWIRGTVFQGVRPVRGRVQDWREFEAELLNVSSTRVGGIVVRVLASSTRLLALRYDDIFCKMAAALKPLNASPTMPKRLLDHEAV
jgi:hypothetical protein